MKGREIADEFGKQIYFALADRATQRYKSISDLQRRRSHRFPSRQSSESRAFQSREPRSLCSPSFGLMFPRIEAFSL